MPALLPIASELSGLPPDVLRVWLEGAGFASVVFALLVLMACAMKIFDR